MLVLVCLMTEYFNQQVHFPEYSAHFPLHCVDSVTSEVCSSRYTIQGKVQRSSSKTGPGNAEGKLCAHELSEGVLCDPNVDWVIPYWGKTPLKINP